MADDVNLGPVRVARKRSDLIARKYFLSQAAIGRLDRLAEAYGDSYSVVLEYLILGASQPATGSGAGAPVAAAAPAPGEVSQGFPPPATDDNFDLED